MANSLAECATRRSQQIQGRSHNSKQRKIQTDTTGLRVRGRGFVAASRRVCLCRLMLQFLRLLNRHRSPVLCFIGDRLGFSLLIRSCGVLFDWRDRSGLVLFLLSLG
ncbi:hypothetical protein [Microcoleus sp. herbarium5]|uniref:hypothetical protein n=1 Tax=Microcoleus sp. herbarium5 TaxID=3055434 RepID=UPI002FD64965